jgi:hypothetical protein
MLALDSTGALLVASQAADVTVVVCERSANAARLKCLVV